MASDWPSDPDSVLKGLFGSLLNGAANGRSTANMWQALREGAYTAAQNYLNMVSPTVPTEEEIQDKGQELIGHVTIMDMNKYTQIAGEALRAKASLQSQSADEQILGESIWTPPWSRTAGNPAIPTRYQLRVLRSITYRGINVTEEKWSTYEITSPLTTVQDALDQADALFHRARYNNSAGINAILDYSITAI